MHIVRSSIVALAAAAAAAAVAAGASALPASAASAAPLPARSQFVVGLPLRDEAGLDALLAAQADPGSPLYRHYLTPSQVRDAFGASRAEYEHVAALLRARGLTVRETGGLRTSLDVTTATPAAALSLSRTVAAELRRHIAAVADAQTPFHSGYARRPAPVPGASRGGARALATALQPGPDGGYGPQSIAAAFDFPSRHGAYSGRGATVADVWDGEFDDEYDVAPYLAQFGIARTGPASRIVLVDGGCGGEGGCADSFSAATDAEGIVGTAPGAALMLYEVPSLTSASILDAYEAILKDGRADVVNLSYAGCETQVGEAALLFDRAFKLGAAEGISFEGVTFGGSHACPVAGPSVQAPADSPGVLAVGGADTFVDRSGKTTRPPLGNVASGGGYSALFPLPAYQKNVPGILGTHRNVPDVAGPDAIDSVGASVYFSYGGGWLGGLSFVYNAPLAGALAQAVEMQHGRLGALPARFYALAKTGYPKVKPFFYDVTLGCNGPYDSGPYCAAPGYDRISGIGVPDMYELATKL